MTLDPHTPSCHKSNMKKLEIAIDECRIAGWLSCYAIDDLACRDYLSINGTFWTEHEFGELDGPMNRQRRRMRS